MTRQGMDEFDTSVDYYAVLQVRDDADPEVVQAAYRRLARKYAAEAATGNAEAAEKAQALKAAYDVVGHESRRAEYDDAVRASAAAGVPTAAMAPEVGQTAAASSMIGAAATGEQVLEPPPGESVTAGQWTTWLESIFPLVWASALVVVCIIGIYNGFRQLP